MEEFKKDIKNMRKNCRQFIGINLYALGQILILIAILLCVAYCRKKGGYYLAGSFLTLVAGAVCLPMQLFYGKTKVKNRSGKNIEYIKEGEDDRDAYTLISGKDIYDIDGIKSDDVVYKIPGSIHVKVKKGKVIPASPIDFLIYKKEGGVLTSPPDSGWNALFPKEKWV